MSGKRVSNRAGENVLCPLFRAFSKQEIICEAHVPDCACTVLRYRDEISCKNQRKIYCEKNWKRCEHYLAWEHFRWEDED